MNEGAMYLRLLLESYLILVIPCYNHFSLGKKKYAWIHRPLYPHPIQVIIINSFVKIASSRPLI
jgi:hypothetical protein